MAMEKYMAVRIVLFSFNISCLYRLRGTNTTSGSRFHLFRTKQASMMKPKCHNILQRYGLALAKQATFVYAHGSAVEPRTSAELDSESERMLTEALKLKPNSFSTLICWTESLAERLRRTLSNEVVISILRELGDTFIKALHLKPYRCFILQNWAYALDQTLESMVQYGLLSEDEFMPVFLDFCQAYQFLSGLERVSKGDSRKKSTTSSNSDSTDSTDPNFSISSSKIGEMNSSLLSPPQPDSGKIPKTHLNASVLRSSKSSQILSSGSEVLTIAMGNNSSASQALRSASPAPSSTTFVDPFDNDDWEPKITVTVPLKPLMAFSLMEHSERVGQKAFELLEFMAKNAKNLDTREEAQRHVECLKVLFANKKEIQASNLKRAEETIGLLPVKALRDWERSGLTIEQVAQKFDIFMNCLYFIVDKDTARDPVFNQQKKKRTLQMAPGGSSHHNAHGNSTSANPPNAHGISQTSQNFSPSSSLSNLPQHISPSSSTSSVHQSVAGEGKKATQGQAQKAVASTSAQLSSSPSNVVATSSTAGTTPPSGVSSPYLSDTSTSTGSSTSTTPVAVPAVVVAPSGVNSSTTPAVSSAAYPALRKTLSYDEFEKIVRRENPRTFYSHLVSIGQGGFGEVFTCESTSTGKKVAMKVMPAPSLNSDFLQKHTNEIEAMRRLNHPNIVQFEDVFYYDNQVWLVMEYCDGGTLENLYQEVYLSESEIAYFIRQICIGLNYLHIQQLAHLDIKAENILLNLNGGIKIADFGLVREVAADRDTLTSMVGTSYWMAPEVIQRKPYGQKVDIWALGCVCLELCEGRPPRHEQGSLKAMFLTATQGPPTFNPRPENGHPWSEKMIDFLKQTMHVDPRRRPTASQLLEHPFLQSRTLSVKELRKKLELVFIGASLRANGLL